ncbi:hypothetical protein RRG08_018122 [Elysia crispata]|uniref:Uncharacterized protein n=1 Tax=Elysia crispata TaxID=231223 RepID=A0AAE0ZV02_9GAST|nr:hypothetical protein RRG08_018122 [Elysia crispata]
MHRINCVFLYDMQHDMRRWILLEEGGNTSCSKDEEDHRMEISANQAQRHTEQSLLGPRESGICRSNTTGKTSFLQDFSCHVQRKKPAQV